MDTGKDIKIRYLPRPILPIRKEEKVEEEKPIPAPNWPIKIPEKVPAPEPLDRVEV